MKTAQLAALCLASMLSIVPIVACTQPFVISANGDEVTDQKSGLIWRRCIEGMSWNGTICVNSTTACTNVSAVTPATFTHPEALQCAALASSFGTPWRLPNIQELNSLSDKSVVTNKIDTTTFPAAPVGLIWSSTPYTRGADSSAAWVYAPTTTNLIVFTWGEGVSYQNRGNSYYVRLVRNSQ